MRVIAIVPGHRKSGASFYSDKFNACIDAEQVPFSWSKPWRMLRAKGDVYHIEFEYRIWGGLSIPFLPLVCFLLSLRKPVFVALHGLLLPESLERYTPGWFANYDTALVASTSRDIKNWCIYHGFWSCIRLASWFVRGFDVSHESMKRIMEARGYHYVFVVPHGTDDHDLPPRQVSRIVRPKIAYFGFVRPQKGIEQLVEAFAMFGRGELLITGTGVREGEHVPIRPVPGLTFINRFIPDEEIREILKDTDIIALPYTDRFPHISGMAHSLAGYGVPMLLSNHLVFADFTDGVDCVKVDPTPEGILAGIRKLVDRPGLYARVAANAKARSVTESWKVTSALFVSEAAKRR